MRCTRLWRPPVFAEIGERRTPSLRRSVGPDVPSDTFVRRGAFSSSDVISPKKQVGPGLFAHPETRWDMLL